VRKRGDAEGEVYMEKVFAQWKAEWEKVNTNFETMVA
jgi:hypothetical protein